MARNALTPVQMASNGVEMGSNRVEIGSNWPILEGPEPQICLDARPTDLQRA